MMDINDNSIYIVGVGACTNLGTNAPSTAAAVRAGIAGFSEDPRIVDETGNPVVLARASYIPDDAKGLKRFLVLGVSAAMEAIESLGEEVKKIPSFPIIIGLPAQRPGLSEEIGNVFKEKFRDMLEEKCLIADIETIHTGHAAGLTAIEKACEKIQNNDIDFCLVGGIDSYLELETLKWIETCDQLHGAGEFNNAWGFIPGEASGFCFLASGRAIREYNFIPLGEVVAAVTTIEKNLIKTRTVCLGEGLTEAFKQVFQRIPLTDVKINHVTCDLNGEPYRADEFGYATTRLSRYFVDPSDFLTPADCWGDVGAASGPLFISLAITAWRKGYAKGPYILLCAGSEGGQRSASVIRKIM